MNISGLLSQANAQDLERVHCSLRVEERAMTAVEWADRCARHYQIDMVEFCKNQQILLQCGLVVQLPPKAGESMPRYAVEEVV